MGDPANKNQPQTEWVLNIMNPILSGPEIIKEILLFEYIICLKNIIFINGAGGRLI